MLTAYFYNKTTGLPLTDIWVTVYCKLADMNSDTLLLNNVTMSASTSFPWAFRYQYAINQEIDYMVYYSSSDSNYVAQVDKLYIPATRWGGGASINIQWIQTTISNSRDSIVQEFDKKLADAINKIRAEFNDTNSHIDIAKSDVIYTIKAIEIPENTFEEKEAKKLAKTVEKLDKKITTYIESEMSEKEEINAISREFTRIEMEEAKKEKEKELEHKKIMEERMKMEEEEDKKIMEAISMEFDKQEKEDMEEKKKELEKELDETLKEAEEIKKELNSLK